MPFAHATGKIPGKLTAAQRSDAFRLLASYRSFQSDSSADVPTHFVHGVAVLRMQMNSQHDDQSCRRTPDDEKPVNGEKDGNQEM
ncbi:hypothetical protein SPBR_08769 [Sporothrix brasiliensis 5110]|uniref:Uncharacterized protein n=1 Tax=Sporothrix brasiliensis 5110 TaxID=1398154 RepID=A0A0C2EJV1_9PEZI|nr:uncharacterized protein SPBR_08769 [Sporothrix brasiliensis 5110]KIH86319.1 hypothetical protein SPBR_08769 [Sporothrix brasiliensis 5110]